MSVKLLKPRDYHPTDGARFVVNFPKKRIQHKDLSLIADIEMQCRPDDGEGYVWIFGGPEIDKELSVLHLLACDVPQKDVAKELRISAGQISKMRKKLSDDGMIEPGNRLTEKGKKALDKAGF